MAGMREPLTTSWHPLLEGAKAKAALEPVLAIARALALPETSKLEKETGPTLTAGTAGIALLHAAVAKAVDPGCSADALEDLEHAVDWMSSHAMGPALYTGFTGVAWVVAHLEGTVFDPGGEDLNEPVDDALETHLSRPGWDGEYDLITGLVGIGVYALERLPRASAMTLLALVIERLDEMAEKSGDGVTWSSGEGVYDLGMAHGVSGVVAFLAAAIASDQVPGATAMLLEGAVHWLLAQLLPDGAPGRYPARLAPGLTPAPTRNAWCYGDPGVAAALLLAARAVGEPRWEAEALATAHAAAARPFDDTGVGDASFCHGASGLAHIFNRLHQATGDELLAEAARRWIDRTLAFRAEGSGIAGFSYLNATDQTLIATPGVLEGAAGIALTLLAALTDDEPTWDRSLLLSNRTAPT